MQRANLANEQALQLVLIPSRHFVLCFCFIYFFIIRMQSKIDSEGLHEENIDMSMVQTRFVDLRPSAGVLNDYNSLITYAIVTS